MKKLLTIILAMVMLAAAIPTMAVDKSNVLFEDAFDGSTLNAHWSVQKGALTQSGGKLTMGQSSEIGRAATSTTLPQIPSDYVLEFTADISKAATGTAYSNSFAITIGTNIGTKNRLWVGFLGDGTMQYISGEAGNPWLILKNEAGENVVVDYSLTHTYTFEMTQSGGVGNVKVYVDGEYLAQFLPNTKSDQAGRIRIINGGGGDAVLESYYIYGEGETEEKPREIDVVDGKAVLEDIDFSTENISDSRNWAIVRASAEGGFATITSTGSPSASITKNNTTTLAKIPDCYSAEVVMKYNTLSPYTEDNQAAENAGLAYPSTNYYNMHMYFVSAGLANNRVWLMHDAKSIYYATAAIAGTLTWYKVADYALSTDTLYTYRIDVNYDKAKLYINDERVGGDLHLSTIARAGYMSVNARGGADGGASVSIKSIKIIGSYPDVTVYSSDFYTGGDRVETIEPNAAVHAEGTLINNTQDDIDVDVILALYDCDGTLCGVKKERATALGMESKHTTASLNGRESNMVCDDLILPSYAAGDYTLRMMIWESANTLRPIETAKDMGADVKGEFVDKIFADNCVLQRGKAVPIWGVLNDNTAVTVKANGQSVAAQINGKRWMATLEPMEAQSSGFDVEITGDVDTKVLHNVVVGDVYLASGQSNMARLVVESGVVHSDDYEALLADGNNSNIRQFYLNSVGGVTKLWTPLTAEEIPSSHTIPARFAIEIQKSENVPVGIIETAIGASNIYAWMSRTAILSDPEFFSDVITIMNTNSATDVRSTPTYLYNASIAPVAPYAIAGVLWYQGEANYTHTAAGQEWKPGEQYYRLFNTLIDSWREDFNDPALPFLYFQVAPYANGVLENAGAIMRESQLRVLRDGENLGMVVTMDGGEETNIHPQAKRAPAMRLAQLARKLIYHSSAYGEGAIYSAMQIKGNAIEITFENDGDALAFLDEGKAEGAEAVGFKVAGADGVYVDATSVVIVDKNTLRVSADGIDEPKNVRYAYENFPTPQANFYSMTALSEPETAALPVSPFSTEMK